MATIEGYCWPLSAMVGEKISFKVSGEGAGTATFSRHGSVSEVVDSITMSQQDFLAVTQPIPNDPWKAGCGWKETFSLTIPAAWPSGIYSATCANGNGDTCAISFVVRGNPLRRARIAVLANVNTWLAYNFWGGRGKYERGADNGAAQVSFCRPNPGAGPNGDSHLTRGELWVLGWLEKEGIPFDVLTDIDFHNEGLNSGQYKCLILNTHSEYWTLRMYDNLVAYLDAGGSLAYLGGNAMFENGEYIDIDGQVGMVFRAGVDQGPREAALFRRLSPARPERAILGVATERSGAQGSPYVVKEGQCYNPLFAFTGLKDGDRFGDRGLNLGYGDGEASGWEVDTTDGPGAIGLPSASNLHPDIFSVPPSRLPDGLVVLARGAPENDLRGADMVVYLHVGGGFVFSAGSLAFGGSLVVDSAIRHIVLNVLSNAGVHVRKLWTADFTGDGSADILFYYPGDDNWWLGTVTDNKLAWTLIGNTAPFGHNIADGRPFWTADFTGDGSADILFYYPGDDNWWLGTVTDNKLAWTLIGNTAPFGHNIADGRPFWTADFTGDGSADILFYYPGDDNWWLGTVTDNKLAWTLIGNTAPFGHNIADGRPFWTADFTGDGSADILFYYPGDDNWWLGTVTDNKLAWTLIGNTAPFGHNIADGRPFWTADFTGDGSADILFYYPGDDNWWLGTVTDNKLAWTLGGRGPGFAAS